MRIDRVKFAAELARADIRSCELAKRAGLTPATVTAVKSGKSCSPLTVEKLAQGLGVPKSALIEVNTLEGA